MGNSRTMEPGEGAQIQNARPTIGLLIDSTWDPIAWDVWAGVEDVAKRRKVNLLCVVGGALRSPMGFSAQANVIYDLVSADNIDGLVLWAGGLAQFVDLDEVRAFCERYHPLPMVAAASLLEGIPSVVVDNYAGMRQAMTHLVKVHDQRRIAFIRGPEGHAEAEERYRAYVDGLTEQGLTLDPNLVVPGGFDADSGEKALKVLLDTRELKPGIDFTALVAANDTVAIRVMELLQKRGVRVPQDVAVIGFDSKEDGGSISPPLTTVPSLAYEQARRATEMVLALMAGRQVPEHLTLPTELLVRQSCGCLDPAIAQAAAALATEEREAFESVLTARRDQILAEMRRAVQRPLAGGAPVEDLDPRWAEHLLAAFAVEVEGEAPGAFLTTLDRTLRRATMAGADPNAWQGVLSALRGQVLPGLLDDEGATTRAENLCQQARVMIGGAAARAGAYRVLQARRQADLQRQVNQSLMTAADLAELTDILARELPRLGIPRCYLSLYEEPESAAGWSTLVLAYDEEGRIEAGVGERRFPSHELTPGKMHRRQDRYSMTLDPLFFREEHLGHVLMEIDPHRAEIHAPLSEQFSSALQKTLLVQKVESHAVQLQAGAEIAHAAGSILELDGLIQQAVDLIRERFGLYYVGLFLLEERGAEVSGEASQAEGHRPATQAWAVLRAGTGEAGQAMLEAGHKLEVGSESMIGWCTANAQARIALDVGEEAVRFDNPLLPQTRSEMALPFVSRGRVIGAMTIQSDRPAAFTPDDITVLQTMADQLANAIENASLFEERERRITELSIINEIGQSLASALSVDELLELVHQQVGYLFDTTNFHIALYEEGSDQWLSAFHLESGERQPTARHSIETGLTGFILRNRRPMLFRTLKDNLAFHVKHGMDYLGSQAQSWLGVPLITAGKLVGAMAIQSYEQENLYSGQDLALFATVAAQVATALDNLRLLETTQQRLNELSVLSDVSQALAGAPLQAKEIADIVVRQFVKVMGVQEASVSVLDPDIGVISVLADLYVGDRSSRFEDDQQVFDLADYPATARVIETLQPLVVRASDPEADPAELAYMERYGLATLAIIPLAVKGQAIGVVELESLEEERDYTAEELSLAMTLANQAAVALENARLLDQTRARAEEQATLRRITEGVSRSLEMRELLDMSLDIVLSAMDFDAALVSLRDEKTGQLVLAAHRALPEAMVSKFERDGLGGTLCDYVLQTRETVGIDDLQRETRVDVSGLLKQGFHTYAGALLSYRGERAGTICCFGRTTRTLRAEELSLLEGIGDQIGVGVANARLFEETQRRAWELEAINQIGQTIASVLDLDTLLRQVVDMTKERFGHYYVGIMLIEGGQLVYRDGSAIGDSDVRFKPGEVAIDLLEGPSLNAEAARTGQPVLVNDALADARFLPIEELPDTRSELDVPIEVKGRIVGVLGVQSDQSFAYDEVDVALVQSLANQIGAAIENARLFEEEQHATLELGQRVQELNILNDIGRRIDETPTIPEFLQWTAERIPLAMRRPDKTVAAIEFEEQIYGAAEAPYLPNQIVQALYAGGSRVGRIYIAQAGESDFSNVESALMGDISRRVSGYIENQRLLEETQRRVREMQMLYEIGVTAASGVRLQETLQATVEAVTAEMGYPIVGVEMVDRESGTLHIEASIGYPPASVTGTPLPVGEGITGWVAQHGEPLLITDVQEDPRYVETVSATRSEMCAPLILRRETIGVLNVESPQPDAFTRDDLRLLSTVASNLSVLAERVRLFEEARVHAEELAVLNELSQELAAHLSVDEVLDETCRQASRLLDTSNFYIGLYDSAQDEVRILINRTDIESNRSISVIPGGEGFTGHIIRSKQPLLIEEDVVGYYDKLGIEPVGEPSQCYLGVPLLVGAQVLGTMAIQNFDMPRAFGEHERDLLTTIASATAIAIQNARLFEAEQRATAQLERRVQQLDALNDMGRQLDGVPPIPDFLQWLTERIPAAMQHPDNCVVAVEFEDRVYGHAEAITLPWQVVQSLRIGGEQVGKLCIAYTKDLDFLDEESSLLGDIARRLGSYIEIQYLLEQTQKQLADLGTIQATMSQLTAALTFDEATNALLPQVADIAEADGVTMYLVEGDYMIRSGVYSTVERDDLAIGEVDALEDYPLTKRVVETRQPLIVIADDPELQPHAREAYREAGIAASATVPLVGREGVVGFLALHRYEAEGRALSEKSGSDSRPGFTEQEIALVQTLADQATIAIEKSRLLEQNQYRAVQLQTAAQVSRAASSILSIEELTTETVNLICDRFDFYYVGLFLVNGNGDYATLRAGTGEAGQTMVEQGHRLLIGGESMIGGCIADKKARIALDVGEEAVRFDNPLLPETRSEMALPLISGGEVQGALSVQSTQESAFAEEDVAILQTMADQVANALANAQLLAQVQVSAERSQTLYETSRALSSHLDEESVLRTILKAVYRTLGCESVAISTVDEAAGTIGMRHMLWQGEFDVFPEWVDQSSYPVDDPDIVADIYRTGRTEVIGEWDERFNRDIWEQFGHERLLRIFAPITMRDRVLGVIEVGYDKEQKGTVSEEEVQLLNAFIDQVAVALQNTRLFAETQLRAEELVVLNEMSRSLSQVLEVEAIVGDVYRYVSRLMDTSNFYIALYDEEMDEVAFVLDIQEGERRSEARRKAGAGLTEHVIRSGEPLLIEEDVVTHIDQLPGVEHIGEMAKSWLGVPMVIGDHVLGVIAAQSYTISRLYGEHHRDLLTAVGSQAAIAIQNARLFAQTQAALAETEALYQVGRQITVAQDVDQILDAVLGYTHRLDMDRCLIALLDNPDVAPQDRAAEVRVVWDRQGQESAFLGNRFTPEDIPVVGKLRPADRLVVEDFATADHVDERTRATFQNLGAGAAAILPLAVGGRLLGWLLIEAIGRTHSFIERDLEALQSIAGQAGVAIQGIRQLEAIQARARHEQLLREITSSVRASTNPDAIMRKAVRELGTALGRPASVRLGLTIRQDADSVAPTRTSASTGDGGDGRDEPQEGGD